LLDLVTESFLFGILAAFHTHLKRVRPQNAVFTH